jgi:RNA polymerase sigma-70 factor (ECF subfamily)
VPWRISIRSNLERTYPRGSSPSSATCSVRNTASVAAKSKNADGRHVGSLKSPPQQHSRLEFEEVRGALAKLLPGQREALILVGAAGFSHEEAAAICESPVGTIKSRVHRARARLVQLLAMDSVDTFGPDQTTQAILTGGARG